MELQYDEAGQGPVLILVHGLGGTSNVWGGVVPTLAREFRVVCPDLRGSGRTPHNGEITTSLLVADLLEFADRLGIERAHWVGHSYGGLLLQSMALEHQARVSSLVLLGPFGAPTEAVRTALAGRATKARIDGLAEIGRATAQAGTSAETKSHRPEVAAFVREMVMRQDAQAYALTCEAIANGIAAEIEALQCPTLVVTGDEDNTAPPRVAQTIANRIRNSEFHILPRCGHWTPVERPSEVASLLLNFLIKNTKHRSK